MNCLHVQWRGELEASPQSFETDHEAQLALDQLLAEHSRSDEIVSIRMVEDSLHWEVYDREGFLCSYWLSEGFRPQEPMTRRPRALL